MNTDWKCKNGQAHYWVVSRKEGVCKICGEKKRFDHPVIRSYGDLRLPAERI